jgi:3-deoxy-manno-octulosonate cytidylyltransferase (CMP-KDO synthetase)
MVKAIFWIILLFQKENGVMKIIGIIPARYASTRFPGKPLADIHGKPMIWWVYQQAKKVKEFEEVLVATDDERIASACREDNIQYVMTSDKHSTGTDRVAEVAETIIADVYVNIQGDEPCIHPAMITELIGMFQDNDVYYATLSNEITSADTINSPNTVKVVSDKDGYAVYFSRSIIPSNIKGYKSPVFRHVGIYAYRRTFLMEFCKMKQTLLELGEGVEPLRALENGYKIKVKSTSFSSLSVDTPKDLERVRELIYTSPPPPIIFLYRSGEWLKRYSGSSSFSKRRTA